MKVYILFALANDYNQPDRAFVKLFWEKPTHEQLKKYGFIQEESESLRKPNRGGETEYWVEEFSQ